MKTSRADTFLTVVAVSLAAGSVFGQGQNLVWNGGFDAAKDPLDGWNVNYEWLGNQHYMQNHTKVSVVPSDGMKKNVVCLWRKTASQTDEVKLESKPIPFEFGCRYKLTLDARTDGPNARIYFLGYQWDPGVHPHEDPKLSELRMIFKGKLLYMSGEKTGPMSNPTKAWKTASTEFPLENASELSIGHLKKVRFLTVYIIALEGSPGKLYVDNVKVVKTQYGTSAEAGLQKKGESKTAE
jgi:hypothetical protein